MGSEENTTKPTIETVLERINEMRSEFNSRFDKVESDIASLRAEVDKGFRQIQRQFDQVAGELTRHRAAIDDHEERFDKLEKQPA